MPESADERKILVDVNTGPDLNCPSKVSNSGPRTFHVGTHRSHTNFDSVSFERVNFNTACTSYMGEFDTTCQGT